MYGYCSIGGLRVKHDGLAASCAFFKKSSLRYNQLFFMPSQKNCPLKFGSAVNSEGMLIEIPCIGKDCAWFFNNCCAILVIAKELGTSPKKKGPKGPAAD